MDPNQSRRVLKKRSLSLCSTDRSVFDVESRRDARGWAERLILQPLDLLQSGVSDRNDVFVYRAAGGNEQNSSINRSNRPESTEQCIFQPVDSNSLYIYTCYFY